MKTLFGEVGAAEEAEEGTFGGGLIASCASLQNHEDGQRTCADRGLNSGHFPGQPFLESLLLYYIGLTGSPQFRTTTGTSMSVAQQGSC